MFLFDFAAAFPSINQTFLLSALQHLGLPMHAVRVVAALYDNCRCDITFGGQRWLGFNLARGIRQGCPLSPLLFAAVLDLFIRKIILVLNDPTLRAFADDLGLVLADLEAALPHLIKLFHEMGEASQICLNLPKTVCIPLWEAPLTSVQQLICRVCPLWSDIAVASEGKYLGFYVGPNKSHRSWEEVAKKMINRAAAWDFSGMGFYYSALAYNIYITSLAGYIGQLENPPEDMRQTEELVLRRAAAGPYRWALPADLHRLHDHFGQTTNFRDIHFNAVASKLRVVQYENARHGGLRLHQRAAKLQTLMRAPDNTYRCVLWNSWFQANPLVVLHQTVQHCRARGLRPIDIQNDITNHTPRPWTLATERRVRRLFQATISRTLRQQADYDPQERTRHKIQRWNLPYHPGPTAARILRRLHTLRDLVPPRVSAATFSAIWNRWTTARRFQRKGRCLFGCQQPAQDSLEHYSTCAVIRTAANTHLRLTWNTGSFALADFLLAQPETSTNLVRLAKQAILLYAVYTVSNTIRHGTQIGHDQGPYMLQQAFWEAVTGHAKAIQALHA